MLTIKLLRIYFRMAIFGRGSMKTRQQVNNIFSHQNKETLKGWKKNIIGKKNYFFCYTYRKVGTERIAINNDNVDLFNYQID